MPHNHRGAAHGSVRGACGCQAGAGVSTVSGCCVPVEACWAALGCLGWQRAAMRESESFSQIEDLLLVKSDDEAKSADVYVATGGGV